MTKEIIVEHIFKNPLINAVFSAAQEEKETVYLVGGAVRDIVMGFAPQEDYDFVFSGKLETYQKALSDIAGFKLITFEKKGITTYRFCFKHCIIDFQELSEDDLITDLKKRDFRVNALAMTRKNGMFVLIDYLSALEDIGNRKLTPVTANALLDDPLRMLRLFRFATTHGFTYEADTLKMIEKNSSMLKSIAVERIRDEFLKMLPHMKTMVLRDMVLCGVLTSMFGCEFKEWEIRISHHPALTFFHLLKKNRCLSCWEIILKNYEMPKSFTRIFSLMMYCEQYISGGISVSELLKNILRYKPEELQLVYLDYDNVTVAGNIVSVLKKTIANYRCLVKGNDVRERYFLEKEALGHLIEKMHVYQILHDVKNSEEIYVYFDKKIKEND